MRPNVFLKFVILQYHLILVILLFIHCILLCFFRFSNGVQIKEYFYLYMNVR